MRDLRSVLGRMLVGALLLLPALVSAATYYSRSSGAWNSTGRWSTASCGGASAGTSRPVAGDTAIVCNGHNVSLNGNYSTAVLTVQNGGTITFGNNNTARTLTLTGNVTVDSGGTLRINASSNTSSHQLQVGGNLSVSGTLDMIADSNSRGVLVFNGSSAQSLSGGGTFDLFSLTLNNANGLTINTGLTVNGTLTFSNGRITTGSSVLRVDQAGSVSGAAANRYVIGNLERYLSGSQTWDVGGGTANTRSQVAISATVTTAGYVRVGTTTGDHPQIGSSSLDGSRSVNRYWTLTNVSSTFSAATVTFNYVAAELDGSAAASSLEVGRYSGGWTYPSWTAGSGNVQASGLASTGLGDFALAQKAFAFNHVRLEFEGLGSICSPYPITVKACADASCSSLYTGGAVTVTLTPTGWVGGDSFSFTGSTTRSLEQTEPGPITVAASSVSPPAAESLKCFNFQNQQTSCQVTFPANGDTSLSFNVADHVAGNTVQFSLSGCGKFGNSTRTVNFWTTYQNPSTGTLPARIGAGTVSDCSACAAVGTSSGTATPISVDFSGGTATFSLFYADVGQVRLDALYAGGNANNDNGAEIIGNDSFIARPGSITLADVQSGSTLNPGASDAAGAKFVRAGEAFEVKVTARNALGDATPNFGKETSPEGVTLTSNLVAPAGGNAAALSLSVPGSSFTSGVATPNTLRWREVGIITLTPSLTSGSYLGSGAVSGTVSGNIGRFVPWQYAVTPGALTNRSALSCTPASTFTYMGETLGLGFTLAAQSDLGATLQNYTGAFAKLDLGVAASYGLRSVGTNPSAALTDLSARTSIIGTPSGTWTNGVSSSISLAVQVARNAIADGPYTTVEFGVDPTDVDGVKPVTYNLATTAPFVSSDRVRTHAPASATGLRFGRLRLRNALGSERLALPIPVTVQYWEGGGASQGFVTNTLDSCTRVPTTAIGMGSYTGNLASGDTAASTVSPGQITFTSGVGDLRLTAPGAGRSGSVDLVINLGTTSTIADTCTPPNWVPSAPTPAGADSVHFRGDWCTTTYDRDPKARARFGVFGQPRTFIYRRENF